MLITSESGYIPDKGTVILYIYRGNPAKTGYSGNMGNRYMQRIVLPQSVFSLSTSVAVSANYYTNQLACNSSHGLKQTLVSLSFDPIAKLFV